ncbi:MAG: S49 family peptidase [Myxococcales bacterium]|nr:S49 family peptidase [Myxococcales bacterium]
MRTLLAGFALSLLVLGLFPQTSLAQQPRSDAGVYATGQSIAAPRGALSLLTNPAGLAELDTYEARLQLSTGGNLVGGTRGAGWGGFLALPLGGLRFGLGAESVRDVPASDGTLDGLSLTRLSFAAAGQVGQRLYFGVTARTHPNISDWPSSWDAGLMYRPWSWLSMGWRVTGMSSSVATGPRGSPVIVTRWAWGFAVRPFAGSDRLTLAWDMTWPAGDRIGTTTAQIRWRVTDGFTAIAEFQNHSRSNVTDGGLGEDSRASLLLNFGLARWGVDVGVRGGSTAGGGGGGGAQLGVRLSGDAPSSLVAVGSEAVVVPLRGKQSEISGSPSHFGRLLLTLDRLADDRELGLVVFRSDGVKLTWSQVEELRAVIARLRSRGKRTAWYGASMGTRGFMVAAGCERIGMPETGALTAHGFSADFVGLSEALTRVGVTVQALRFGEHKSAPEMFTRKHISKTLHQTYNRIIQARWRAFVNAVAAGRSLAPAQVEGALGRGVTYPGDAHRAMLIDAVAEPKAFEKKLRKWGLLKPGVNLRPVAPIARRRTKWGRQDRIVVLGISGNIVDGKSGSGVLGRRVGGAQVARQIDTLSRDSATRALVARIDSGGGAVWGSDAMYHALRRFSKDKPTVASMASVAASGGYWTALGADHIVANRATITGSIGIWVAKPDASGLLRRFGVGLSRVGAGPFAGVTSLTKSWTPAEAALLRRVLGRYYDVFLRRVTLRRKIARPKLLTLAEGRIWLGSEAADNGLIDGVGGLLEAIAEARSRADIADDPDVKVVFMPKIGLSQQIRRALGLGAAQNQVVAALLQAAGPWLDRASILSHLPAGQPLALSPIARDNGRR